MGFSCELMTFKRSVPLSTLEEELTVDKIRWVSVSMRASFGIASSTLSARTENVM